MATSRNTTSGSEPSGHHQRLRGLLSLAVTTLRLESAAVYTVNETRDILSEVIRVDNRGNESPSRLKLLRADDESSLERVMRGESSRATLTPDTDGRICYGYPLRATEGVFGLLKIVMADDHTVPDTLLEMYAHQAAYLIDSRWTQSRLEVEARHERTLLEVSKAITSSLHPNQVLEMIARYMAVGIGSDKCAVYVWEVDLEQLRRRADFGVSRQSAERHATIRFTREGSVAQKLMGNEAVHLELEPSDPSAYKLRQAIDGVQSLAVPLVSKGRLTAVAIVASPKGPGIFEKEDVDLLLAIAAQAAISIENATLYDAQNRAVTELAALYAVSQALAASVNLTDRLHIVAQSISAVSGVSRCGVFLIEEGQARGHLIIGVTEQQQEQFANLKLSLNERDTAMMLAIKEGKPTIIETPANLRDGYTSVKWRVKRMLAVPLITEGRTVGLAVADEPGQLATFSTTTLKVAAAIGEQAALAIQNARLFEQTSQHANDLEVLWEAGQELSAELGMEDLLDALITQIERLPGILGASIIIRNWDKTLLIAREGGERAFFKSERQLTDPCDIAAAAVFEQTKGHVIQQLDFHPKCVHPKMRRKKHEPISMLSVPMSQRGTTLGVINIVVAESRGYTTREVRLIGSLASFAAAALSRAQLFERERRIAETFQRSFLPSFEETYENFEIAHLYSAALDEARVGGDFYDVYQLKSGELAIAIGDVSGKGLDAAVHAAMAKYLLRAYSFEYSDPGRVMSLVNDALCHYIQQPLFITMVYGVLDPATGRFVYANAGHELPLLWVDGMKRFQSLACTGRALGFLPDCNYITDQVVLNPSDTLIVYTDGISEARNKSGFFESRGIRDTVKSIIKQPLNEIIEAIEASVRNHTGGPLRDDIALLVIRHSNSSKA